MSDPYWNPVHRAWWDRPRIDSITTRYKYAYTAWKRNALEPQREQAAAGADRFAADDVVARYWLPILEAVGALDACAEEEEIEEEESNEETLAHIAEIMIREHDSRMVAGE